MLSLKTVENLQAFLLSDCVTVKGSQIAFMTGLLSELQVEKDRLSQASRAVPAPIGLPVLQPVTSPPEAA